VEAFVSIEPTNGTSVWIGLFAARDPRQGQGRRLMKRLDQTARISRKDEWKSWGLCSKTTTPHLAEVYTSLGFKRTTPGETFMISFLGRDEEVCAWEHQIQ
jgi:GNAT superfamily N-acetyltransferase